MPAKKFDKLSFSKVEGEVGQSKDQKNADFSEEIDEGLSAYQKGC